MPKGPRDLPAAGADAAEIASRLRLAVARLHRSLRQHSDAGLSPSQLSALASIERHGSVTLGELAGLEGVAPPTITGVVARLEADGNVAREPDPDDGRVVRVRATDQGRDLVERARRRKDAWLARRVDELDPGRLDELTAALGVLEELAEAEER